MADVVIVSTILAFIATCVAYVGWCDRIVRTDDAGDVVAASSRDAADAEREPVVTS